MTGRLSKFCEKAISLAFEPQRARWANTERPDGFTAGAAFSATSRFRQAGTADPLDQRSPLPIHRKQHGAIFYGCTGSNRFDDPQEKFGVLYAGLDEYAAFIETHGQRTGANAVSESELRDRCLAAITRRAR